MSELKYAKIIDEETHEVQVGAGCSDEYYVEIGMEEMEVEQAYNFKWYVAGYAPEKPEPTEDGKKKTVRGTRNFYLEETDFTQLPDVPLTEEEKEGYRLYRQYLRDYTESEEWWEENPKTYDEWKED